jgi:uncharacterized RmlC-like cupin family protein
MTRGARGLVNHLVAGTCGAAGLAAGGAIEGAAAGSTSHVHDVYESAIYTVSGETEVWHGEGLRHRVVVTAAVSLYVPPGTPHLPVNRSEVTTVAVVARTDPREQESVVALSLPPHLADLDAFPVAAG